MKTTGTAFIRSGLVSLALCAVALIAPAHAHAQATLVTGLGAPPGITGVDFGPNVMTPNDDGSSAVIDLTAYNLSGLCFFGATHNSLYINNNGNVTFNAPVGTYTPTAFPVSTNPMIAPWWADVDTRGTGPTIPGENRVYWSVSNGLLVVTWYRVGYYSSHIAPYNTFQLVIRRVPTMTDPNNYDVEFRYATLNWTTGDASGGAMGLGGTAAQAGFDAGDSINYQALPGSRTAAVLNLLTTSNTVPPQPGLWVFNMRSCNLTSQCITDAQCGGNRPVCDTTTRLCRACAADTECPSATPACLSTGTTAGSCAQCSATNISACSGAAPACDLTSHTCACLTNANCGGATPICDITARTCRACDAAQPTDCTGTTPACATAGPNSGQCVQCTATRPAACVAPTSVCDLTSNVCRACVTSADCAGATPVCDAVSFTCRACNPASATDCTGATPVCATAGALNGRCVQCTATQTLACLAPTPLCEPTTGTCVACNADTDCSGATPVCNMATHTCRACTANADCSAATPVCELAGARAGACVQCNAGNTGACTGTLVCNPATDQCVGCITNTNCAGGTPICDGTLHVCRACNLASGADCTGTTPTCASVGSFMGQCVQCEPGMSAACTGATPVCDGTTDTCRGCVASSDCSGGTPLCDTTARVCRACTAADCTGTTPVCEATGPSAGRCVACDATNPGACTGARVCDVTTNTCVGCRTASDCSGATPLCDAVSRLCRACVPADCVGAAPVCATMGSFAGGCVQCEPGMSAACTGATPLCNTATDLCVGCATDVDCSGATPVCDPTAHTCRACVAADCTGATPVCVASGTFAGHCEQCATGFTAACTGATPVCDVVIDRCVLCVPGPTGDASACAMQTSGHACIAATISTDPAFCGCVADGDCGGATSGRICEPTTHLCIDGCWPGTGHNGCPVTEVCSSMIDTMPGHCGAVCTMDSECPTAHPHCLPVTGMPSVCVDCASDTHCAGRTDGRTRCIGADHTCAQCTATDVASCDANTVGSACLGTGLCGCSADGDCSASRRCDSAMHVCVMRPAATDGGTDASTDGGVTDASTDGGVTDGARMDGGVDAAIGQVSGNGACACRTAGARTPSRAPVALTALALAALVVRRRRRVR